MNPKVIIISGASRGIGRATALHLAQAGHSIVALARNELELCTLTTQIIAEGGQALGVALDIADEQAVAAAVQTAQQHFGGIDALINNAGIGVFVPLEQISGEDWTHLMDTNVKGTFLLTKYTLSVMKAQGRGGHIITVASDVSRRTFANGSLYCASKYAQDAMMTALRREVHADKIKVSVVYPGLVDTYFHRAEEGAARQTEYLKSEDIADALAYILHAPAHVVIDELMLHPISQAY